MLLCHGLRKLRKEHAHKLIFHHDLVLTEENFASITNSDDEVDLLLQYFIYNRSRATFLDPNLSCVIRDRQPRLIDIVHIVPLLKKLDHSSSVKVSFYEARLCISVETDSFYFLVPHIEVLF